jgi:fluoride exporter
MLKYVLVALGGALGSVSRFWVSGLVAEAAERHGSIFPWNTLVVNITGSLVIGVIAAVASAEGSMEPRSREFATQFLMIGICGGYTTFSSFSLQTLSLLRDREWLYAAGNMLLSVSLCMVAVWIGYLLGSAFNSMKGN